jgi:hypothetical protein
MRTITQETFKAYQALNPNDTRLQKLTLDELYANTGSGQVDWDKITYKPGLLRGSEWDCGLGIGYVVFDCICLFIGAVSLRSSLTAEAAEDIAKAAEPVANQMEGYIKTISASASSKTEVATAVFGVISTLYSGSCLGAVIGAFLGSLTWYNAVLYGATALGTIMAAVATDGVAEIGIIVVELATAGFLVGDSIKCADACSY